MPEQKVLFICIHNSARSQMAEAFLNQLGRNRFIAESAGLEPGKLNPLVVRVLRESGIDISANRTKTVDSFLAQKKQFDFVITVCDEASAESCPVFPGKAKKLHWSFPDPSGFQGTEEEKMARIRIVRDEIKKRIGDFLADQADKD
jgi:arsenate reductase